jgi:hypothetical protein
MDKKVSEGRRNFLKASAVGAAGLAVLGPGTKKAAAANINTTLVNLSATQINQSVDNLRVAYITDAAMVRSNNYPGWDTFNDPANTTTAVNYAAVKSNVDKLACALANKTNANDAWTSLLKIPSTKTWATAKAAIKVNAFASDHPSVPIVARIVEVLVGFGMPAANICLFDGIASASGVYGSYVGAGKPMPAGITYAAGLTDTVTFPAPLASGGTTMGACTGINGADLIVNISCNKGHDRLNSFSGVTMCLKNNFATINWAHQPDGPIGMQVMAAANSCSYLVGNIPASYPAKQQLCIVDCLWLGNAGDWAGTIVNGGNANSIVMGTFAGAVDYVATMKIRASKANYGGWNQSIVDGFVTGFGYAATAKTTVMTPVTGAGQGLVDASAVQVKNLPQENPNLSRQGFVQVSVSGEGIKPLNTNLNLAKGESIQRAEILNVQGKMVRSLPVTEGSMHIIWDGRSDNGRTVRAGSYILKVKGERSTASAEIVISR